MKAKIGHSTYKKRHGSQIPSNFGLKLDTFFNIGTKSKKLQFFPRPKLDNRQVIEPNNILTKIIINRKNYHTSAMFLCNYLIRS